MRKNTVFCLSGILMLTLLGACASGATNPPAPTTAPELVSPTFESVTKIPETIPNSVPIATSTIIPMATSRGSELEATDPESVALASGGLQLVEFFRFT